MREIFKKGEARAYICEQRSLRVISYTYQRDLSFILKKCRQNKKHQRI